MAAVQLSMMWKIGFRQFLGLADCGQDDASVTKPALLNGVF